jgi:hypothetical protein
MKSNRENKPLENRSAAALVSDVKKIVRQARSQAYTAVNSAMVQAFWLLGRRIVKEEQGGEKRAEYGQQLIATLARELTDEFGKGFLERNVWEFRKFYLTFPLDHILHSLSAEFIENAAAPILHALNAELKQDKNMEPKLDAVNPESERNVLRILFTRLSWTHIRHLLRVSDPAAREYYIREAAANAWSTRTLDRNISTQYYQRLLASQVKEPVVREMEEKTASLQRDKLEFIKNPTVGIVLCSETDHDIARYSILKGNEQIFATKYKLYLPTAEELAAEIAREKEVIRLQIEHEKDV